MPYKAAAAAAFQPVNERAIVNDRWTSNGQHVLHTTERVRSCIYVYARGKGGDEREGEGKNSAAYYRCERRERERDNARASGGRGKMEERE